MDDEELHLDLAADELEAALPADFFDIAPPPTAEEQSGLDLALPEDMLGPAGPEPAPAADHIEPVALFDPEAGDDAAGDDQWELGLRGPFFESAGGAGGGGGTGEPASLFSIPENLFATVEGERHPDDPVTVELDLAPAVASSPGAPDSSPPDPDPVGAESTGAAMAGLFPGAAPEALQPEALPPAGARPPAPSATPATLARRLPDIARRNHVRLPAAGVAASVLVALAAVLPDRDGPRRVETALPRPSVTVTTVTPPVRSPLSPLVPAGSDQPVEVAPDTPAPAAGGDPQAPGGTAFRPGPRPGPASAGGGSPARTASPAAAAPRSGATSTPAGRAPGPSQPPSPAPAPAPAPAEAASEPEAEPERRDRRSEATSTTATPTTEPPPPPTTAPPSVDADPPFTTAPPPTPPPTEPPTTTPPTTAPPPPPPDPTFPSVPTPTRPCLDGSPPRPAPC